MDNFGFEQQGPRLVNPDATGLNDFFKKVYTYMALALLVTAATAYLGVTLFAAQIAAIFSSTMSSLVMFAVMMGFVWLFSSRAYTNPGAGIRDANGILCLERRNLCSHRIDN